MDKIKSIILNKVNNAFKAGLEEHVLDYCNSFLDFNVRQENGVTIPDRLFTDNILYNNNILQSILIFKKNIDFNLSQSEFIYIVENSNIFSSITYNHETLLEYFLMSPKAPYSNAYYFDDSTLTALIKNTNFKNINLNSCYPLTNILSSSSFGILSDYQKYLMYNLSDLPKVLSQLNRHSYPSPTEYKKVMENFESSYPIFERIKLQLNLSKDNEVERKIIKL